MRIIGITGPTGAGKSLLSEYLRQNGIPVIDADKLYHTLLIPPSPCLDAIREAFGEGVFRADGTLDRTALSQIVFHDGEKLELLNKTVLGLVLERARQMLSEYEREGHEIACVDAPTLIESGFSEECERVVSVLSAPAIRIERIMQRDGIDREAAVARVSAQREDGFYIEHSDIVMKNNGDTESFFEDCRALLSKLNRKEKHR